MGRGRATAARRLREIALDEIARTQWFPAQGENRITGMVTGRPDWVRLTPARLGRADRDFRP